LKVWGHTKDLNTLHIPGKDSFTRQLLLIVFLRLALAIALAVALAIALAVALAVALAIALAITIILTIYRSLYPCYSLIRNILTA
jgi:Na+/H+ antiporter NhaB